MRTQEVLARAREIAHYRGREEVEPQHVLLAMLLDRRGPGIRVLTHLGVPLEELARELETDRPAESADASTPEHTWSEGNMLARARHEAQALGHPYEGCEHLLLAFLQDKDNAVAQQLSRYGVQFANARAEVLRVLGSPIPKPV